MTPGVAPPTTPSAGLPTRLALPAPPADLPAPVRAIVQALAPGWRYRTVRAHGPLRRNRVVEGADGHGHLTPVIEMVDSISLRLCHHDSRSVVALWVRNPDDRTPKGKPRDYGFDLAVRGRHPGENGPTWLNADQLAIYVSSHDLDEYAHRLDALAAKSAATAAKAKATRAANKAAKAEAAQQGRAA